VRKLEKETSETQGKSNSLEENEVKERVVPVYQAPISRSVVEVLKQSKKRFGDIYPVVIAADGEVIDGRHRLKAGWENIMQLPIKDPLDKLALRLVLNVGRRVVSAEEKYHIVNDLAQELINRGCTKHELIDLIADLTGFTRRWVYNYLDKRYKMRTKPTAQKIERRSISIAKPYKRVICYFDVHTAKILDELTKKKGFKSVGETIVWLVKQALKERIPENKRGASPEVKRMLN